jgi:bifunctional DNA-binding transcriptional regulator/antitoxin component of YhaV-PrlF toxin-antitoxin module
LVKFEVTVNSQGKIYLPSEIRRELAVKELEILGNAKIIVLYPRGTQPSDVLKSLEVVQLDLQHRAYLELKDKADPVKTFNTKREIGPLCDV